MLWTQVYLAQHYEYLGDFTKALQYIDSALMDTPTLPELYMIKGRIYKVRERWYLLPPAG